MQPEEIALVGGGLVGALAAIVLAQRDYSVTVYERRADMRSAEVAGGRSINLAVTSRGLLALEHVGLKQAVLDIGIPMRGRMVHSIEGETTFIPYGQRPDEVIYSVSRGALNKLLLQRAGAMPRVKLVFDHQCVGYSPESCELHFRHHGLATNVRHTGPVIATDGSGSELRASLAAHIRNFNYSQQYLEHGYKELVVPASAAGGFAMEKNALHIWPRQSYMLIALPNLDGSFTCTLFLPYAGETSFAALQTPQQAVEFFEKVFPDAAALMPTLAQDFAANRTSGMVTVKCQPWHLDERVMLLGDAAHAIVPFFGQGMNCGFEDCTALGALVNDGGPAADWALLFAALERERRPNADAIADMAIENFLEMRDTVADPKFALKKQIGFELERRHPQDFVPRYSMVVFHPEIPYAEARRRGIAQDKVLEQLAANVDTVDAVDWSLAEQLLRAM
jgi:kynurenine 3-monooxygenase